MVKKNGYIIKFKKILYLILNEIIYGGHLLSFGVLGILYSSALLLGILITWDFLLIAYLGSQVIYLYNRYKEFKIDYLTNPTRTEYLKKYINYILPIIAFYILAIVLLLYYFEKFTPAIFVIILIVLSLLYSHFFKKMTKNIKGFKNFFVSFMWGSALIFLALYYSYSLNSSIILLFIFIFLRLFIHENICDIKDIKSDKKEKLITLIIFLGEKKLLDILQFLNILSFLFIVLGIFLNILPFYSLSLILTVFYAICFFKWLKSDIDKNFLYNAVVDGEFIFWPLFILLGKILL